MQQLHRPFMYITYIRMYYMYMDFDLIIKFWLLHQVHQKQHSQPAKVCIQCFKACCFGCDELIKQNETLKATVNVFVFKDEALLKRHKTDRSRSKWHPLREKYLMQHGEHTHKVSDFWNVFMCEFFNILSVYFVGSYRENLWIRKNFHNSCYKSKRELKVQFYIIGIHF